MGAAVGGADDHSTAECAAAYADIDGRADLKKHLKWIMAELKREKSFSIFEEAVTLTTVPDYAAFVPERNSMFLRKIRTAVDRFYSSSRDFLADIKQIEANARIYNRLEGGGRLASPWVIDVAHRLVSLVKDMLSERAEEIEAADRAIIESERPAQVESPPRADPVEATDAWLACDRCKKWRMVTQAMANAYEGEGVKWFCYLRPHTDCSMPDEWNEGNEA